VKRFCQTKIKSIVFVALSTFFSLFLFLCVDLIFGEFIIPKSIPNELKPYQQLDKGWYELRRNFRGQDQYGNLKFPVETDKDGFRIKPKTTIRQEKSGLIFLGDSFTYGINGPWEETFVGILADNLGLEVLNAGTSSYSVTPYLYQYKRLLKLGRVDSPHILIVGIDISDVRDEGDWWTWPSSEVHPVKRNWSAFPHGNKQKQVVNRAKAWLRENLPLTRILWNFIRYGGEKPLDIANLPMSSFTWMDWNQVDPSARRNSLTGPPDWLTRGFEKISARSQQIVNLAHRNQGKVFFLAYPWPAQLAHKQKANWSDQIRSWCYESGCDGVIDTLPIFEDYVQSNPGWIDKLYVKNDMHFSKEGNNLVANVIQSFLEMETLERATNIGD